MGKMRPLQQRFRRTTVSRSFRTFRAKCRGQTPAFVAKECRELGKAHLNAAAVEVDRERAAQNYELAFRFLDVGYAYKAENASDPLYAWAYAQACYFTGRFRVALLLHQMLVKHHSSAIAEGRKPLEFYQDVVLQAAIVLKHMGSFQQSRDLFCVALGKVPSRYSVEAILVQVCRCMELSGNISGAIDAYFELYTDCFADKLREERDVAFAAARSAGVEAAGAALSKRDDLLTEKKVGSTASLVTTATGVLTSQGRLLTPQGRVLTSQGRVLTPHGRVLTPTRSRMPRRMSSKTASPSAKSDGFLVERQSTLVAAHIRAASHSFSRSRSNISSTVLSFANGSNTDDDEDDDDQSFESRRSTSSADTPVPVFGGAAKFSEPDGAPAGACSNDASNETRNHHASAHRTFTSESTDRKHLSVAKTTSLDDPFEEFREWFWSPSTWTHFGDLYMQTVDATLAADAYFVAIQRYESPNHIPDRLLLKMATACVACRNIDTAREFVELLIERDPGRQTYLDLYYQVDSEVDEAEAFDRAIDKVQAWYRTWRPHRLHVKEREAAFVISRALRLNHRIRKMTNNFASEVLHGLALRAVDAAQADAEIKIIEYFGATALYLRATKYFRLWGRFAAQAVQVRQQFAAHPERRAPGRQFLAWSSHRLHLTAKIEAFKKRRTHVLVTRTFTAWVQFLTGVKLAALGHVLADAQRKRHLEREKARKQQELQESLTKECSSSVPRSRPWNGACTIQALCRGHLIRKWYKEKLWKVKTFWASLVMGAKQKQEWQKLHAGTFAGPPGTVLPSEVEACWKKHPCPFPGRLLASRNPFANSSFLFPENRVLPFDDDSDAFLREVFRARLEAHQLFVAALNDSGNTPDDLQIVRGSGLPDLKVSVSNPRDNEKHAVASYSTPTLVRAHSAHGSPDTPTSADSATSTCSTLSVKHSPPSPVRRVYAQHTHAQVERAKSDEHARFSVLSGPLGNRLSRKKAGPGSAPDLLSNGHSARDAPLSSSTSRRPSLVRVRARGLMKREGTITAPRQQKIIGWARQREQLPSLVSNDILSPADKFRSETQHATLGNKQTSSTPRLSPALRSSRGNRGGSSDVSSANATRNCSTETAAKQRNAPAAPYTEPERLHDHRLVRAMKHLVNHTTKHVMFGTPVHGHAHDDRTNKIRSHKRLSRIAQLQQQMETELQALQQVSKSSLRNSNS